MHWFTGEIFLGRELLCLFVLSENSCDLYNTVGKHQFFLGHKKRAWYSRQASPTFSRVEVAGWILLGCLGEMLKLMKLTGKMQELEDSWCTTGFRHH